MQANGRDPRLMAPTSTVEDVHVALGEIVDLLHQACREVWRDAATDSPRASLGIGIYLVYAQVGASLPITYQPRVVGGDRTVLQLLRDAEHRTRSLPLDRTGVTGMSGLAVALCDLIREANHCDD
ncbi:hypothetical protein GCM10023339_41520 [Alloalcanivorax gelatiniphagus]